MSWHPDDELYAIPTAARVRPYVIASQPTQVIPQITEPVPLPRRVRGAALRDNPPPTRPIEVIDDEPTERLLIDPDMADRILARLHTLDGAPTTPMSLGHLIPWPQHDEDTLR
jgi:hypothetical protein